MRRVRKMKGMMQMNVNILIFGHFRKILGAGMVIEVPEDATITTLLETLAKSSPEGEELLFDGNGELRGHVLVMRNRVLVDRSEIGGIVLGEDDEIAIYPPVSGG